MSRAPLVLTVVGGDELTDDDRRSIRFAEVVTKLDACLRWMAGEEIVESMNATNRYEWWRIRKPAPASNESEEKR